MTALGPYQVPPRGHWDPNALQSPGNRALRRFRMSPTACR
jgi:hypothetical protein